DEGKRFKAATAPQLYDDSTSSSHCLGTAAVGRRPAPISRRVRTPPGGINLRGKGTMKIPRPKWLCHFVSLIVFPSVSLFAQTGGAASSCIQDSTLAAIPHARVVLERHETRKRYQTQTDEKGCFTI